MVNRMNPAIQRTPMNEAMDDEEMRFVPDRHHKSQKAQQDRVIAKGSPRHVAVGIEPQDQDLIGSSDRNTGEKRAQHPFDVLALEQECAVSPVGREATIKLEAIGLSAPNVEFQLDGAIEHEYQSAID